MWEIVHHFEPLNTTAFNLNKLAYLHEHKAPFKGNATLAPEDMRFTDKLLNSFNFKLPH